MSCSVNENVKRDLDSAYLQGDDGGNCQSGGLWIFRMPVRVTVNDLANGLTNQERKCRFRRNIKLARRAQKSVYDARDGCGELKTRSRYCESNAQLKTRTKPVTGLNFAKDEAYETDCGMSMQATVMPPSTSPPRRENE